MWIDHEIIPDTVEKTSAWESFPTSIQSWHQHNPTTSSHAHRRGADAERHKPPWLVPAWFRAGWSFAVGSTCHDATADHWKIYSKQALYIQQRNGYMNQCSVESQVNRFTVFGGHPRCQCAAGAGDLRESQAQDILLESTGCSILPPWSSNVWLWSLIIMIKWDQIRLQLWHWNNVTNWWISEMNEELSENCQHFSSTQLCQSAVGNTRTHAQTQAGRNQTATQAENRQNPKSVVNLSYKRQLELKQGEKGLKQGINTNGNWSTI